MTYFGIKDIMSRLHMNPKLQSINISSVAIYIKDFISITEMYPAKVHKIYYSKIIENSIELPGDLDKVDEVYLCSATDLPDYFFSDNRLTYTHDTSVANQKGILGFLGYTKRGNRLFFDIVSTQQEVAEIHYRAMNVDTEGFPVLPYDGSLMQAIENYIKYRYYTILAENKQIDYGLVQKAESEYLWYMGQYKNKNIFENVEDAEGIMQSTQKFTKTRSKTDKGSQYPQTNNF